MKPKIMAGSTPLYTSSRYFDLLKKTVGECIIGYNTLINSFYNLASHDDKNDKYNVSVAVLLVMLFEAPRFPAVFKRCLELLTEMEEGLVGDVLEKLMGVFRLGKDSPKMHRSPKKHCR
ncbi:hypothetical protein HU200_031878 [Digitaria exilis]|uniref:Uncharacterized protein n=1 Tax=Digitaria exilis TaxID=1010633 RepID=A0A835EPT9_9POAL|nr:hypothetical protein HU200_031878 [Digitaria exilis]